MASVPPPPPRPEDETNPYAAPEAGLGPAAPEVPSGEAEAIRRAHINLEASIKAVGALYFFSATMLALGAVMILISVKAAPDGSRAILAGQGAFNLVLALVFGAIGVGLRGLLPWGRWLAVGTICTLFVLSLGNIAYTAMVSPEVAGFTAGVAAVSSLIPAYILYLLLSPKGATVFSPEYKRVIAETPHVRYRTSCIVWGFVILLVVVLLFALLGGILAALNG